MNIAKHLAETNENNYNFLKLAEECTELSDVLIKSVTKQGTDKAPSRKEIIEEIGDVLLRIDIFREMLQIEDLINLRKVEKLKKYEKYIEQGKYVGRI